jgi:hypothetical protein
MANDGIPAGWSRQVFTDDKQRADARAKELRKSGQQVRVFRHFTEALSGRAYTEYIVATKAKG